MDEKVMTRASKWDVSVDTHVETEIKHDCALPVKVDDSCTELVELNHEDRDVNQNLRCLEAESCLPRSVAAKHPVETEIKHSNALTATVDDSCIEIPELNQESHDCSQSLRNYESVSCLPMNMDSSEIVRSDHLSGQVENNNVTHSDDFCENAQKSKQLDLEGDCKDGFKNWEIASQDQTMKYSEYQDKPLSGTDAMSPGSEERKQWNPNISPTDGWSRSGRVEVVKGSTTVEKRSRSFSHDSRRSRSPSYASKQVCESWVENGSTKPAATVCRDFTAGRCRRGSECIYLHEGGRRQIDRHHDFGSTYERESRFERGRHQGYVSRECREKNFRRHEDHFDDKRDNNQQHRDYISNEMCFDFLRGRCHRGASCKYIHNETSSDGGRNVRDELRERVHDRRDERTSFGRRFELQRVSSIRCKYFLEGRCRNGENCKFFHQVGPLSNSEDRPHDDSSHHHVSVGGRRSANASELLDQDTHVGPTDSLHTGSKNALRVVNTQHVDDEDFTNRSVRERHPTVTQDAHSETQPSGKLVTRNIRQKLATNVNTESARGGKDVDFTNNILPLTSTASQHFHQGGQSQVTPQLIHTQKFVSNSPFQQFVPQLPFNGQMQQVLHQSGQNPFTSIHKPDAHRINATMQNNSTHHPRLNPQQFDRQVQPSLLVQSHVGNHQNHNVNGQIQQNLPLPYNGQSQPNFNVSCQIKQNLPSQVGHSQQNIVAGDTRHILAQNVQIQQHSGPLLVSNGQIQLVAPKPPSNLENVSSDEKNSSLTSKNNLNPLQQPKQIALGQPLQVTDLPEVKPSVFNSDNLITQKLVTTEQAAKITDLSASLAQFFGSAALNSQTTTEILPPADLNPGTLGSLVTVVTPLPTNVEDSKANLNHSATLAPGVLGERPLTEIHMMEQIREGADASSKEAEKSEKLQSNKEPPAQSQNSDPEGSKDGDAKKSKEAKGFRMFKCALVELVKDMLKPTWKEGHLSKEAHNTIVKKVVDKVTGSLQGPNAPQTQEKIDLYLSSSKAKLSKFVQAYVEKYVGR